MMKLETRTPRRRERLFVSVSTNIVSLGTSDAPYETPKFAHVVSGKVRYIGNDRGGAGIAGLCRGKGDRV